MLDVLIVGGGPVGLFLACLLAGQGLSVQVAEQRRERGTHSRAIGIHAPALRAFEAIGLSGAVLEAGVRIRRGLVLGEGRVVGELGFEAASPSYPFVLSLPQQDTERLLEERLCALAPGTLQRGVEVRGLQAHPSHLTVILRQGGDIREVKSRYVVGADGWRSTVRRELGLPFPGAAYRDTYLMGDFPDTTPFGTDAVISLTREGVVESFPLPGGARRWVAHTGTQNTGTRRLAEAEPATLTALIEARTGLPVPAAECRMLSAFGVSRHLAPRMVQGRAALIGDAAHVVSPIGGQGMNLGWLDALALAPLLRRELDAAAQAGTGQARSEQASFELRHFELRHFEQTRRRAAWLAARQAELNMALGRPTTPCGQARREEALGLLLSPRVSPLLAQAFSMRWLA